MREQEETSHCSDAWIQQWTFFKLKPCVISRLYNIDLCAPALQSLGEKFAHFIRLLKPQEGVDGTDTWPVI